MEIRLLILFLFTCTLNASERQAFDVLQQFLKKPSTSGMQSEKLPGMTNENYLITDEKTKYVVRLPGYETAKFVDRFSEWKNSNAAFEFHFNPAKFLFCDPEKGAQITSYIPKFKTLKFEAFYEKDVIAKIAALLNRVHESQMPFTNHVDIFQRINALAQVLANHSLQFPAEYSSVKAGVDHLKKTLLNSTSFERVPCHGDPVPSNFMILSDQLMLFDWEYSGLNDPAWDLAFLSCAMNYSDELDHFLVSSYRQQKNELLYAKMIFFKPIVEFWLGLWGLSQTLARENCAEKEFFRSYAISRFRKSQRYQESDVFNRSLEAILKPLSIEAR